MKHFRSICSLFAATIILTLSLSGCIVSRLLFPDTFNKMTAHFSISLRCDACHQEIDSKLIEEDPYGRQMFWISGEYILGSRMSSNRSFYVIQQKNDKKGVYYYEDIAWCFDDTTREELEHWKNQNDWGLPLCAEKMTYRECHTTVEGYDYLDNHPISYSQVEEDIDAYAQQAGWQVKTTWLADSDETSKELWVVEFVSESSDSEERYIILTKGDAISESSIIVTEALTDRTAFTRFKYDNGWHYPDALISQLLADDS